MKSPQRDTQRYYYIKGKNIGVAREEPADRRLSYENWLDPVMQRNFNYRPNWASFEEFCAFFDDPNRPPNRFIAVVVRLADEQPVGRLSLSPEGREPDLGISIYRQFRGLGYGAEAFRLAVDYIFQNMDLHYIVAGAREDNKASIRMLEKIGFKRDPDRDEEYEDNFGEGRVQWPEFRLDRSDWSGSQTDRINKR